MLTSRIADTLFRMDSLLWQAGIRRERTSLSTFLFHALVEEPMDEACAVLDPTQCMTVSDFRRVTAYLLSAGYQFVGPADLGRGDLPPARYAMLTFDDGYYNNARALPVLREYGVPALFNVSTQHIAEGRAFWCDVLHRELRARGEERADPTLLFQLRQQQTAEINAFLDREFGRQAAWATSDLDRPFTAEELRTFAGEDLVTIGNHTSTHTCLTTCDPEAAADDIAAAQRFLQERIGVDAIAISYPYGYHSPDVRQRAAAMGIRVGLTVESRKNPLPLSPLDGSLMKLGRFWIDAERDIEAQCRSFRSDISTYCAAKATLARLRKMK